MADHKSNAVIAELAALKERGDVMREQHRKIYKELSDVFTNMSRLNHPTAARGALDRRQRPAKKASPPDWQGRSHW
jgi:hypothetical protein